MSTFKNIFLKLLDEDGNVAGPGGALGTWTSSQFSGDNYAPGDSRMPKVLGGVQRRIKKKRKKKKKKNG
tara:strand:+ start:348 stop:554 length:207 start_codon:yes stop_codon:yes gene_type:complete